MPQIRELVAGFTRAEIMAKLEGTGLLFAPIGRPEELFDVPHLIASEVLETVIFENSIKTQLPPLPSRHDTSVISYYGGL